MGVRQHRSTSQCLPSAAALIDHHLSGADPAFSRWFRDRSQPPPPLLAREERARAFTDVLRIVNPGKMARMRQHHELGLRHRLNEVLRFGYTSERTLPLFVAILSPAGSENSSRPGHARRYSLISPPDT